MKTNFQSKLHNSCCIGISINSDTKERRSVAWAKFYEVEFRDLRNLGFPVAETLKPRGFKNIAHEQTEPSQPKRKALTEGGVSEWLCSCRGVTLIEIVVAVAIFSLMLGGVCGLFVSVIRSQRHALASQTLLDQASYALEYISRAIRMAKREGAAPACLSQNGWNYEATHSGQGIKFINSQGVCQEFFVEGGQLKEWRTGYAEPLPLSSSQLAVQALNIALAGETREDNLQPKVTIFWKIKGKGEKPEQQPELEIQTTISQRNLDD